MNHQNLIPTGGYTPRRQSHTTRNILLTLAAVFSILAAVGLLISCSTDTNGATPDSQLSTLNSQLPLPETTYDPAIIDWTRNPNVLGSAPELIGSAPDILFAEPITDGNQLAIPYTLTILNTYQGTIEFDTDPPTPGG